MWIKFCGKNQIITLITFINASLYLTFSMQCYAVLCVAKTVADCTVQHFTSRRQPRHRVTLKSHHLRLVLGAPLVSTLQCFVFLCLRWWSAGLQSACESRPIISAVYSFNISETLLSVVCVLLVIQPFSKHWTSSSAVTVALSLIQALHYEHLRQSGGNVSPQQWMKASDHLYTSVVLLSVLIGCGHG